MVKNRVGKTADFGHKINKERVLKSGQHTPTRVVYQLGYQANCELVTLRIHSTCIPTDGEDTEKV